MQGYFFKNQFVITCAALIAAGSGFLVQQYGNAGIVASAAFGVAIFAALMVLHNNLMLSRHFSQTKADIHRVHAAQDQLSELLLAPKGKNEKSASSVVIDDTAIDQSEQAASVLSNLSGQSITRDTAIKAALQPDLKLASNNSITGETEIKVEPTNVVQLTNKNSKTRITESGFRPKPSQLKKALNNGGVELYLQPILEIPTKSIRYFEALARLQVGEHVLTPAQFFPVARESGLVGRIDLVCLQLTVKLVRGLQRQDNEYPVFWNISAQTLGNQKLFGEILDIMRANQTLNRMLICEISQSEFVRLNRIQNDNLSRISDLGFDLSLDQGEPGDALEKLVASGRFVTIKVPSELLIRISAKGGIPIHSVLSGLLDGSKTKLIASHIETESQTMAVIDADITLAQGNGLVAAKPLKKDLGARS